MPWLCLPASSTKDSSMVSSTGPISTPWRRNTAHVVLDVLADLQHRGVFQQRLQLGDRRLERHLARQQLAVAVLGAVAAEIERALRLAARRAMAERQVGRAPAGGIDVAPRPFEQRQRHADQAGIVGIERVGLAVEGDGAGLGRLGDPFVERLLVLDQLVVGGREGLVGPRAADRRGLGRSRAPASWSGRASRPAPRARSPRPARP